MESEAVKMKKILCAFIAFICLFLCAATADVTDVSNLSFEQLQALQIAVNDALWASSDWKKVTVPAGVYKVGEDIPAGRYTISLYPKTRTLFRWGTLLKDGTVSSSGGDNVFLAGEGDYYYNKSGYVDTYTLTLVDGQGVWIKEADMIFQKYVPAFSFE